MYFLKVIRERGIKFIYDYFMENILFDIIHGTKTASRVTKENQKFLLKDNEKDEGLLYVASFTSVVQKSIKIIMSFSDNIGVQPNQFIDLGCGKGKSLIIAFKKFSYYFNYKIIGIEYDPNLIQLCNDNIKKVKASAKIKVINASATSVTDYIEGDLPVVYLYNSFQGDTFRTVINSLKKYRHFLIYVDPVMSKSEELLDHKIIAEHRGKYNADTWKIYYFDP